MTPSDGYISGTYRVVDHGADSQRYNIVILGDGYRASELTQFAKDVEAFVDTLRSTAPYTELWCAINVHRVDVVSNESGADDPGTCGDHSAGSGAAPKTYFDSTFCGDGEIRRLLTCDSASAKSVAVAQVPAVHMTMVIVNSPEYGGSGGEVATFSTNANSVEIGLHEMGHTAFGFADEYEYYQGCGSGETGHDKYTGSEPSQPNVTANTDHDTIKWKAVLTSPTEALPTTSNADCTKCDPQANPETAGYVGAYEGAKYFHCGLYRSQFTCRMRELGEPFCAACQEVIRTTLGPFKPGESLTLATPSIAFNNIPAGLGGTGVTTYRAIVFEVLTCATRTFRITAGPTGGFGLPFGPVVTVSANDADPLAEARLWISYTSTTVGSSSNGAVTVICEETGQTWIVNVVANTVARPKSAVTFVLDHSGSMAEDVGDGTPKVEKLREAAKVFIDAMLEGDGLGIIRFDETAQILMPVTDVGTPISGAGRTTAIAHIEGSELDPAGDTSIGAGVIGAKQALDDAQAAASPHYDVTAMLVLTDGMENTPPMLSSVASSISANAFAIGLGVPENISVAALNLLTQGHDGYLLVTGTLTPDQSTRLEKYFLQILAGVTNANVILDPHGNLTLGVTHRIPFRVSETDFGLDVFLMCPLPSYVDFALEAPDGRLLTPASVGGPTNAEFVETGELAYYRLSLPALPEDSAGTHAGLWHAILRIAPSRGRAAREFASSASKGRSLPYDLVVHCYSNLMFNARVQQTSFEPGATVAMMATLLEYDVPVLGRANVWAQVVRPDGSSFTTQLDEAGPGRFEQSFPALLSGLYTIRLRALGATFRGTGFEREQTLTAAVYARGNHIVTEDGSDARFWCELLECLLSERVLAPRLRERLLELGLDLDAFARCSKAQGCGRGDPLRRPTQAAGLSREELRAVLERVVQELTE